ncbi:MAG: biopolymer transporter ExbD [Legionellales bacterium]|nr:biopolymer transporter ExbD [Legionellales bacterium]|tara:strand:- start:262 stop:717 length:456 start_codon:yes stop_codon:yes gene_type:complete
MASEKKIYKNNQLTMNFKIKNKEELTLDITPLIDVVFLLLIFFMVSTTFKHESEISITLPTATNEVAVVKSDIINIGLDVDGNIYINGKVLTNSEFETIKKSISKIDTIEDPPIVISADANVKHQSVIQLLDALRQLDLLKITFATQILED